MSEQASASTLLQAAREAESRQETAQAADLYEQIAGQFSDNKSALLEAGARLIDLNRPQRAIEILTAAAARYPRSLGIRSRLARALSAQGNLAGAMDQYREQARRAPEEPITWLALGDLARRIGQMDEAMAALTKAMTLSPDNLEILRAYSEVAEATGRTDEAEAAYRHILSQHPEEIASHSRLARLLMLTNQLDEAEAMLRNAITQDRDDAPAHITLAAVLLKRHRFVDALAETDVAVAIDPNRADAHNTRGIILLEMNQPELAVISFSAALRLAPKAPDILFGMANALGRGGSHAEAVKILDRVLALDPANAQARHFRAAWSGETTDDQSSDYARTLFDGAAQYFDQHLVNALEYSAPENVAMVLQRIVRRRDEFKALCDVGCGTGLVAQALAAIYDIPRRVGIDVSSKMIAVAESKKLYDELIVGDAVPTLSALCEQFELITAIDMLIYVGALEKIFAAFTERLAPGGLLVFSIENGNISDGFKLSPSGRFVHATPYLAHVVERCGLKRRSTTDVTLRIEAEQPQAGQLWVVQRPS